MRGDILLDNIAYRWRRTVLKENRKGPRVAKKYGYNIYSPNTQSI